MWVVAIVLVLAVLILLVGCVPLEVSFRMQASGRPAFAVRVIWGFGLMSKELAITKKPPEKKGRAAAKPKPKMQAARTHIRRQILRGKGILRQLRRLVIDILCCLRLKELNAAIRIGLDDPADTGMLFALLGPAVVCVRSLGDHQITIMPAFEDEAVFEGYAHGIIRVQPIQLIPPFVRFVFSSPTVNVLKVLISNLWQRQK